MSASLVIRWEAQSQQEQWFVTKVGIKRQKEPFTLFVHGELPSPSFGQSALSHSAKTRRKLTDFPVVSGRVLHRKDSCFLQGMSLEKRRGIGLGKNKILKKKKSLIDNKSFFLGGGEWGF